MKNIDSIAADLFDKIRARFNRVRIGDEKADDTQEPEKARFFNFDYVSHDGEKFGNILISIINSRDLKIYFSKNITEKLNDVQQQEWYSFLRNLRMFAKRHLMNFSTKDITRNNLELKDVKNLAAIDAPFTKNDVNESTNLQEVIEESALYGTKKRSYQEIGKANPVKLVINHSSTVDESIRGARTRQIESVFVETANGERFKLPFTNLTGARAMGNHIANGGYVHDDIGVHIGELVNKMKAMRKFVRATAKKTFESADAGAMVESAIAEYNETHQTLSQLRGPKGYKRFVESFVADSDEDVNIAELKEKFTRKVFDDRLEEALPYVYRAHAKRANAIKEADEFEQFMSSTAGSTSNVNTNANVDIHALSALLSTELPVGADSVNALPVIHDFLTASDTTSLESALYTISTIDANIDVAPMILSWIETNDPELFSTLSVEKDSDVQTESIGLISELKQLSGIAGHQTSQTDNEPNKIQDMIKNIKRRLTGKSVSARASQEITKAFEYATQGNWETAGKHFRNFDRLSNIENKPAVTSESEVEEGIVGDTIDTVKGVFHAAKHVSDKKRTANDVLAAHRKSRSTARKMQHSLADKPLPKNIKYQGEW